MKTSVIDVRGMLSALSAERVEKRIGKVPGVASVTVNDAAGSATVRYDETFSRSPISRQPCTNPSINLQANPNASMRAHTSPHASGLSCQRRTLLRPPLQRP